MPHRPAHRSLPDAARPICIELQEAQDFRHQCARGSLGQRFLARPGVNKRTLCGAWLEPLVGTTGLPDLDRSPLHCQSRKVCQVRPSPACRQLRRHSEAPQPEWDRDHRSAVWRIRAGILQRRREGSANACLRLSHRRAEVFSERNAVLQSGGRIGLVQAEPLAVEWTIHKIDKHDLGQLVLGRCKR